MPKFNVTRSVPYSLEQVFEVASDVASYRTFLPLVNRSLVRNRRTLPDGRETFVAELTVTYKKLGIKETMTSQVVVDHSTHTVTSHCNDGPVKELKAQWLVTPTGPNSCEINFDVDYTLKSRALQFVLSGMFDMIVRRVMTAFENRARELYGAVTATR